LVTCRENELLEKAGWYLIHKGIYFNYFNENPPERITQYGNDCRKISVDLMFDDKSLFPGWFIALFIILWKSLTECIKKSPKICKKEETK
jgi:hypothetical protein